MKNYKAKVIMIKWLWTYGLTSYHLAKYKFNNYLYNTV